MTIGRHSSDELSVNVGSEGIALSSKGDGAKRLANSLADILSPFSNSLGWVGDQLTARRIESALRAAKKAQERLEEDGIVSADIPPKVLLPWLENASLEEVDGDDTLTESWAGLLVSAAKSRDAAVVSYIETLKRMGKDEAKLLQFFATDTSPKFGQKFYGANGLGFFSAKKQFYDNLRSELKAIVSLENLDSMRERFNSLGIQGMAQIIFFETDKFGLTSTSYFEENEHAISNLEHLGLIKIYREYHYLDEAGLALVWFQITKYAFDLVWACQGTITKNENLYRD